MSRFSNGFLRVVLHAGHCTDDLASVDFIIYVARSPKWLYERCPRGTNRGKRRLRIAKQGHLRALTTDVIPRYEFTKGLRTFRSYIRYTYACTTYMYHANLLFLFFLCVSLLPLSPFFSLAFYRRFHVKHLSVIVRLDERPIDNRNTILPRCVLDIDAGFHWFFPVWKYSFPQISESVF